MRKLISRITSIPSTTIIFTILVAVSLLAVTSYFTLFATFNHNSTYVFAQQPQQQPQQISPELIQKSREEAIQKFQTQFCGLNSKPNNNSYVTEYVLPQKCEMPLGILVNNDSVWYISSKHGTLGKFDIQTKKFKELTIPFWSTRSNPIDMSQSWDVEADPKGNIWFTDEKQNGIWKYEVGSGKFSFFLVPEVPKDFGTIYPVSMTFDEKGNVYFAGIRSQSLWIGNITKLKNGTSDGISYVKLPIEGFKGIDPFLISTGSVQIDNKRNVLWVSMLAFGVKGEVFKYDISKGAITVYDLPPTLNSPVGIVLDENGNPWISDHGTSIFFMLNPSNGKITEFTTSPFSKRIAPEMPSNVRAYTLPYWIRIDSNNSFWFNEHIGNKIGKFDPKSGTLIEYWIPTQNPLWGMCQPPTKSACGIANALQFSIGKNNQLWFSEWTENKLGMLNTTNPVPFEVNVAQDKITVKKGETKEIPITISANKDVNVRTIASSTITATGGFGNATTSFSQDSFSMTAGEDKTVSFLITPSEDIQPGEYTMMLGVEDDQVSYLKSLSLRII